MSAVYIVVFISFICFAPKNCDITTEQPILIPFANVMNTKTIG